MPHPLSRLKPTTVFDYFYQITQIPRPSKKEHKMRTFVKDFASTHGLESAEDEAGNIVIYKKPFRGYDKRPSVLLQGHLDMVCEKTPDTQIDFENDPITPRIDGTWVRASGTTLGADNGIALATMLSILADPTAKHGPLECLFTVDEETGLNGAKNVNPALIRSRILLNLDSEEEGVIFIGCAGGKDATLTYPVKWKTPDPERRALHVSVTSCTGGHSGMDIHLGRANAIKCLARVLWSVAHDPGIRLASIRGGNLRNAIPRDAEAVIVVRPEELPLVKLRLSSAIEPIVPVYASTDPNMTIRFEDCELPPRVLKKGPTDAIINLLHVLPHGVQAMSKDIPGVVETSLNLATVETRDDAVVIGSSQRSSIEAEKRNLNSRVRAAAELIGCDVVESDGYPGWQPDPNSAVLAVAKNVFQTIYRREPLVTAIHAGLECGLLKEKFPDMDMISFGPTIMGAHSPDERLLIPTVEPFYRATLAILESIGNASLQKKPAAVRSRNPVRRTKKTRSKK